MTVKGIGFIITLGILLGSLAAQAQQTGNVYRIGFLGNSTAALEANLVGPFREGLRDFALRSGPKAGGAQPGHRSRMLSWQSSGSGRARFSYLRIDCSCTTANAARQVVKSLRCLLTNARQLVIL